MICHYPIVSEPWLGAREASIELRSNDADEILMCRSAGMSVSHDVSILDYPIILINFSGSV
jgi:hypothetical protein